MRGLSIGWDCMQVPEERWEFYTKGVSDLCKRIEEMHVEEMQMDYGALLQSRWKILAMGIHFYLSVVIFTPIYNLLNAFESAFYNLFMGDFDECCRISASIPVDLFHTVKNIACIFFVVVGGAIAPMHAYSIIKLNASDLGSLSQDFSADFFMAATPRHLNLVEPLFSDSELSDFVGIEESSQRGVISATSVLERVEQEQELAREIDLVTASPAHKQEQELQRQQQFYLQLTDAHADRDCAIALIERMEERLLYLQEELEQLRHSNMQLLMQNMKLALASQNLLSEKL